MSLPPSPKTAARGSVVMSPGSLPPPVKPPGNLPPPPARVVTPSSPLPPPPQMSRLSKIHPMPAVNRPKSAFYSGSNSQLSSSLTPGSALASGGSGINLAGSGSWLPAEVLYVVRAEFDFIASEDDELSFKEGELICVLEDIGEGWLAGRIESRNVVGIFPINYVKRVQL